MPDRKEYAEVHQEFVAWLERTTLPPDAVESAWRLKLDLWAAAHNDEPPPTMVEDAVAFIAAMDADTHQN